MISTFPAVFYIGYIYHAWPRWAWSYTVGPQLYLRKFTYYCACLNMFSTYKQLSCVSYQVATPSLARMRGSFCLVRLLKTFKPVSNPLGFVHFVPETLLPGPVWTDRAAPMSRRRTLASLNTDRTKGLHMAMSVYPTLINDWNWDNKMHSEQYDLVTIQTLRSLSVFMLFAVISPLNYYASFEHYESSRCLLPGLSTDYLLA